LKSYARELISDEVIVLQVVGERPQRSDVGGLVERSAGAGSQRCLPPGALPLLAFATAATYSLGDERDDDGRRSSCWYSGAIT